MKRRRGRKATSEERGLNDENSKREKRSNANQLQYRCSLVLQSSHFFLWLKNSRVLKILTVFRSTENSERKRLHSQAPVSFSDQTMSFHFERTSSCMYVYWIFLECNSLVPQVLV